MAPGPGGSPFRARWDATSVSFYSVVNEPGGLFFPLTLYSTLFSGLIALQWELFFRESPLTLYSTFFCGLSEKFFEKTSSPCIPHFFQILQPVGGNFFSGKVPSPCIPHFFRVWTKKISNFFCRKTVGTLSSLIIESKNIFCEIFFRTKKKQKKKTGSADSRRRTREAIRGATEKRAFSLLFFFCFSIYSFSCIVHIGGSW